MKISTPLVTLCAAAALALPAAHAAVAPLPSGNLLQNPGAEAAPGGKNYEQVTVPGWTTVNGFNALAYLPGSLDLPSTADAGRLAAGAEPLDAIIAGALLLVGNRFRKAGVRLDLPAEGQPHVLAERVRLEQVIVNLLQNAIDAVTEIADPHVALLVSPEGRDVVRLPVADNGPDIDPALAKEIFRPFITGKPNGLGLGLGIAQDIMNDLGGSLTIGSSPLGGAAFVMTMRRA